MDLISQCLISLVLALLLSLLAYKFNLLTKSGCISAFVIGFLIGFLGAISWLILLIAFTLLGFAATLMGLSKKREKGLQEGNHGERGYKNILGVAIPPLIIAVLNLVLPQYHTYLAIAYIATISVAAADTIGSELGVKDPKVWLITNFKRVEPGTDGGISVMGTLVSLVGAIVVSIFGYFVIFLTLDFYVIIPIVCGFIGCLADSVVGATLETKGYVSKYGNNCITGIIGGLLALLICLI